MVGTKENNIQLSGANKAAIFMLSLGPENSATLLERMEVEEISDLSQMMANLGTIDASTVEELLLEFTDQLSSTGSLLGTLDATERLLLSSMEKVDPDLANEIRELCFTFEDILKIDDEGVTRILKEVISEDLVVALKTASDELKTKSSLRTSVSTND